MSAWIGVDLDGTLAHYDGWRGPEYIGEPDNGIFHLYNISSRNRRTKPPSASMRCGSSQAGRRLLLLQ